MARSKDKAASATAGTADGALDPALPQKKRARRRLVGAAALCLLAAIVLPLVLDSEPRRTGGDVQVSIPSRDTPVPPLAGADGKGAARVADAPAGPGVPPPVALPPDGSPAVESPKAGARPAEPSRADAARPDAGRADGGKSEAGKAEPGKGESGRAEATRAESPRSPAGKPEGGPSEGAKSATRTEPPKTAAVDPKAGSAAKPADASRRYMLQVGAFASEKSAAEQVAKVKAAGLSAYTEKVQTTSGERVRVRVGPFGSRELADQARGQLKLVGIDSALIAP